MTNRSRSPISQNTEITEALALDQFLAAVCWGTLAGTGAMMTMMLISSPGFDFAAIGGVLVFTSLFVSIITLLAMLLIGLPLTLLLRAVDRESAAIYASAGGIVGYLILALMAWLPSPNQPEAVLFPLFGSFAGGACALRWGKWREKRAIERDQETNPAASHRRDNPIHELIH